jgi:hypothetical protein
MSNPITYKTLVEAFRDICLSQESIKQFNTGMLSDLDIENEINTFQRFPLAFLKPETVSLDRYGKTTLTFTFIVSDIAKDNVEDLTLNTYNSTLMIAQDILSKIVLTDWEALGIYLETPVTLTAFQERFNSNLAGWAATLDLTIKSGFNLCDAAFK